MAINNIPVKQKQTELVALLRARFRAYRRAKYVQGFFVSVAIILPVASTFLVSAHPKISPYFAFAALLILFLDVAFFQTFQKDHIKTGAKLQEEFDIEVFELPWNYFIAGQKIDHEDVRQLSAKYLPASEESWLISWYDPATGEIPLTLGRLVCQRSNVTYDARLRKRYGNGLLYGTITLGVSLVIVGIAFEMSLSELLLTVGVPSTPIFNWVLRERKKQVETTAMLLNLKTECEKLWNKALSDPSSSELVNDSRQLQDAIFQHRASSPLVFDWVYKLFRRASEDEVSHAANKLVDQAKAIAVKG